MRASHPEPRAARRTALLRIPVSKHHLVVLPWRALRSAAVIATVLLLALLGIDRYAIPALERRLVLCAPEWRVENDTLNANRERSNLCGRDADWTWTSSGLPVEPIEETHRILLMGDSFVWGDGYANANDLAWRQLQRELRTRGYEDVRVIAAGLRGVSTEQELEAARGLVARWRPGLIIWGYVTNDPDVQLVRHAPTDLAALDHGDPVLAGLREPVVGRVLPHLQEQLFHLRMAKLSARASGPSTGWAYDAWELKLLEGASFERYREVVTALGRFQAESGVPGFVLGLAHVPSRRRFDRSYQAVRPLFEAAGLPFVSCLEALEERWPDGVLRGKGRLAWGINPANGHPCPEACRVQAIVAADELEAHHPEVLGARTAPPAAWPARIVDWLPSDLDVAPSGDDAWTFTAPADPTYMPTLPGGEPYVLLSFDMPLAVDAIGISGPSLARARIAATSTDPVLGCDDREVHEMPERAGRVLSWEVATQPWSRRLNTLRVLAAFSGPDRRVRVTVGPAGSPP